MDYYLQFYQPNYNNFPITNEMQCQIAITPIGHIANENENDYKEIICDGKKRIICSFPGCGKIYCFKSEFIRHKVIHTSERTLNCPFKGCKKTFKRKDVMSNHIRTHTGETPFQCQEAGCGKSFPCKAGLNYHSLKHKGEKGFRCRFPGCNKTFLILSQLKQHEGTLSYHQKLSNPALSNEREEEYDENSVKITKTEDTCSTRSETKHEEKVEWGVKIKSETEKSEEADRITDEEFRRIVLDLVSENNAIKMKLNMLYSGRGWMPENIETRSKYNTVSASDINKLRQLLAQEFPGDKAIIN